MKVNTGGEQNEREVEFLNRRENEKERKIIRT